MIRPEAAALIARWREAAIGGTAAALGLWLLATTGGLPFLFGIALTGLGTVLAFSGLRHARFRTGDDEAPGLVEVDEARITYLGPVMGGSVALDDLTEVTFRRTATGEAFWRLVAPEGTVYIPEGARGAEQLLDALAPLPGFDGGAMVRAVQSRTATTVKVWSRPGHAALSRG
ncbi:hypothetical protein [Jannaschia formosa]|uniref:hypothetical protein n=1 Tax=Jannaschia formosa TaxID=2259592 RepID=UPI000E1BA52E|nr:hypothetical protein [Jannaschia formosa]TFL19875.1 hypothetical protein DR046_00565 [Jannaschia formosa]